LIVTDCQIAQKDWPSLLASVSDTDWGDLAYYQLAVQALAERSLGQDMAASAAWQKAVHQSARRLDRLSRLSQVTAVWHWTAERTEVLQDIITAFPKEKWAADQLLAQFYLVGDTRGMLELLSKIQAADPGDARLKNNLASVFLLLNSDLEKAHRMAKEAYQTAPDDPFFASTYAYSLLLQQKPDDALNVLQKMKPEYLRIPSVAAYYGVIQSQTGHPDLAKEFLARADAANLLPEEKEMVRRAKTRM
jgi:Flp pilus assembly protein TadD